MDTKELNSIKEYAYKLAVNNGFYKDDLPDPYYLGLVMSEAGRVIIAHNKGLHADTYLFISNVENGLSYKGNFEELIKDSMEDAIADMAIRLLEFAGMKKYDLSFTQEEHYVATHVLSIFDKCTLPGVLFGIIGTLSDAATEPTLEAYISIAICVLSDGFKKMTNSDKDLWWFIGQKMHYNELTRG